MKLVAVFLTIFLGIVMADPQFAVDSFVASNGKFSGDLYTTIAQDLPGQNFVFSPLSVELILSLARFGANGNTSEEITSALGLPDLETTAEAMGQILPSLMKVSHSLNISTANGIFLDNSFSIRKEFEEIANNVFDTTIGTIDFGEGKKSAKTINEWVSEKTNNQITNIINQNDLTEDSRMILLDAISLYGTFMKQFQVADTSKEDFYQTSSKVKEVDMMFQEDNLRFYECNYTDTKFLELDYKDQRFTMTIALPNEVDGLPQTEKLMEEVLSLKHYKTRKVMFKMPQISTETSLNLVPLLEKMGVTTAFSPESDFSGISFEPTGIDNIIQKASIKVNEGGTKSDVGGNVGRGFLRMGTRTESEVIFAADHPFCYFIKFNNIVVLMGRKVK